MNMREQQRRAGAHKRRFDKPGNLMLWRIINPPNEGDRYPVRDLKHAAALYDSLTASDLLDDAISSNAYGLEIYDDNEWLEFETDDGDCIAELADAENAATLETENTRYLSLYPRP